MTLFKFVYTLLYRVLLLLAFIFKGLNPKLKKGFELRKKQNGIKPWLNSPSNTQPLWFHCASGEYEYAKPVIRLIKQNNPNQKIMVTYFSPSVEKALSQAADIDFYCPMPWDTPANWREFLSHHKPKALLVARTDLWPNMLHSCKQKGLPSLLFSKTVNVKKSLLQKFVSTPLYRLFQDIFCVSEEDRNLLYSQLKPYQKIHAAGDTRYDQCLYRIQHGKTLKPLNNFKRPIFIAGSSWKKDEDVLMPLIETSINSISFIVAPHEPSKKHLENLTKELTKRHIKFQFYSETTNWDPQAVLIIDTVGILADLYSWADFSFIGGSMDRSVHSVMEPLAQGNLCFVGPKHKNNREALLFQNQEIDGIAAVQPIKDSKEFVQKLNAFKQQWGTDQKFKLKLAVKNKSGSSLIVKKWIDNTISKT